MCKYASLGQGTLNKIIEMKNITETVRSLATLLVITMQIYTRAILF